MYKNLHVIPTCYTMVTRQQNIIVVNNGCYKDVVRCMQTCVNFVPCICMKGCETVQCNAGYSPVAKSSQMFIISSWSDDNHLE